jgi:hypothetical protein
MPAMIYLNYLRVQWLPNDIINLEGQKKNLMNKLIL